LVVNIEFDGGVPVALNGARLDLTELVTRLAALAAQHGVGRTDILESRVVGFKSRGIYESPAASVLHQARAELEALVLDRETLHHKRSMSDRYAELVYYGYWFSDLRKAIDSYCSSLAPRVTGKIAVELYKGSVRCIGRESDHFSRYDFELADYQEADTFVHEAGAGFAYCWALPLVHGRHSTASTIGKKEGALR
jgi:argininosuccinate synthase